MKNIITLLLALTSIGSTFAQSNAYWYNSKKAKLTQYAITENESYMFPTYDAQATSFDDTIAVAVTQYETAITVDSISSTVLVALTPSSAVLAGAKLHLYCSTTGGLQTVYVKQGSSVVDTLQVGGWYRSSYVFDGSQFVRLQYSGLPAYKGAVTQASSITTGVTINADAGVITTVSSTLAIDSNASFTVTNSAVTASSVILLSIEYAGNGSPYPTITSTSAGSFVLKLKNLGNAALNGVIKIHYLVLNK